MDFSFDIENAKGDHILVALSNYDHTIISAVTDDPDALNLCFYDVSLVRKSGTGMVGYKVLMSIARILADFLQQQGAAVLCFYCDGVNEVYRHHMDIPPQQYRSQLFSRMFDHGSYFGFVVHVPTFRNTKLITNPNISKLYSEKTDI